MPVSGARYEVLRRSVGEDMQVEPPTGLTVCFRVGNFFLHRTSNLPPLPSVRPSTHLPHSVSIHVTGCDAIKVWRTRWDWLGTFRAGWRLRLLQYRCVRSSFRQRRSKPSETAVERELIRFLGLRSQPKESPTMHRSPEYDWSVG